MSFDRRTDGPTLLRAEVAPARRSWRRRHASVRVTSRRLCWGPTGHEDSVDWADVREVHEADGALLVAYLDDAGRRQELRVVLQGPVGYLVAEEVRRRSEAAARNAAAFAGAC